MKLHGEEVKVGDRVWHLFKGWGEVIALDAERNYPICIRWKDSHTSYTKNGKAYIEAETPVLFWQPIEIDIPKKPKQKEKAWQWICKTGNIYWLTSWYYASKEEVLKKYSITEPIEPYLPSEIEREKSE